LLTSELVCFSSNLSMPWRKGTRLPLVGEYETDGHTQEIYQEVKQTLGVPQVNTLFQAFALYPKFLDLFWRTMRPALETQQFFRLGERLRAAAYTCVRNYFSLPDLCPTIRSQGPGQDTRREITETVEVFHYLDPLLLLLAEGQMSAFEEPLGQPCCESMPAQHPVFARHPLLLEEEIAPPRIKAVYADMKHMLGGPALSTAYLAFARFPAFLESYWNVLRPITQSALYTASHRGAREIAWSLVREFPARVELTSSRLSEAGLADEEITAVARISELFVEGLSRRVVNVTLAKICLEGGNSRLQAPASPVQGEPKQAA
jgi:hypothetical protein